MESIVPPPLEDYCREHSTPASTLRQELEAYTHKHCALPQMLTGAHEAALLQMLVRLAGARRVLEIGTFTGYSALAMAEALPADGSLVTCDNNAARADIAQSFFNRSPHGKKIQLRLGPALETLATLPPHEQFDLAFLDADKAHIDKMK